MPNSLTLQQLNNAKAMIDRGDLKSFYDYMHGQGYGYANLAKGVVECSSSTGGAFALQYMTQVAKDHGINLTVQQVAKIEIGMANGYLDTLIAMANTNNKGFVNQDINGEQALQFHNNVFDKNGLPRESWTLYTPSLFLSKEEFNTNFAKSIALSSNVVDSTDWMSSMYAATFTTRWDGIAAGDVNKINSARMVDDWLNRIVDGGVQWMGQSIGAMDKISACTAGMELALTYAANPTLPQRMLVPQLNTRGEVIGYVEQALNSITKQEGGYVAYFDSGAAVVVNQGQQSWVTKNGGWRLQIHTNGKYEVCTYQDVECKNPVFSYDKSTKTSLLKLDNNNDGRWDQFNFGFDSNRDGRIDQFISTGNSFADLLNADRQMRYLYGQGSVLDSIWRDYSNFSTYQLVYSSPTFTTPTYHFGYDPIGAFYESKAIATDNATSIAKQTFRVLDGNGKAVSAAQLLARDSNKDGKLSGAELDGLTAWQDGNEDGVAQAGENITLASALSGLGLQAIRASDVGFYTAGQAVGQTVAQSTALAPLNIKMPPVLPTAWGSNYAALRDKEKFYAVPYGSGGIIFWEPGQIRVSGDQKNMIGTDNNDSFDINYYAQYNGKFFNLALIQNFYAGGGDDLMGGSDRNDNLWGGTGNDILWGYAGDDRLYGEEGNDELDGGAGNDLLDGGSGNDLLFGQDGNDTLIGGDGQDELIGGNGHDVLDGGNGNDKLFGGVGNDVLNGGDGDDFLQGFTAGNDPKKTLLAGETDDDVLFGGAGNDQLFGGLGNDYLDGGIGQDYLDGGAGDDTLFGGAGDDEMTGDSGNDVMDGGSGADKLFGGVGNDRMWGGDGDDIMMGFTAINETKQTLASGETDDDVMYGGAGNDLMIGGLGNDQLWGGTGNDELQGGEGDDWLYGEAGNDRLFGGAGDDVIYGGDGDDLIIGGVANNEAALPAGTRDNNFLYGGAGNDTIIGGIGNDYIDGGAGADTMEGGKGNDIYIVNSVNDVVLEQLNEGYDTVVSSVNYILNANIEELRLLEGYTINGTGNSLNNLIIGNSRDNILDGVTGADTMIGGLGNDIYYVDNAGDQVIELAGEGVDTVYASISYALGEHVENLTLLDFSKPEKGLADGVDILVYGYPKANELDYMQGNAIPGFKGTCALTSITNLATQANIALTEGQVVQRAIDNKWCVTDPVKTDYQRGGSNFHDQQALLDSYGIRNGIIAGYNEQAIANLIKGGRGVIIAVNSGKLWNDAAYLDDGSTNHVVTVTGVACDAKSGEINGFYIADSGRGLVSDMTRYIPLADFRRDANVTNAYAIYTIEPIKLWEENINATGNALDNQIIGNRGDNVLTGGKGNDTLIGQAGNDRYVFNRGDGQDLIIDQDATLGNTDTLQLNGINQTDLWFSKQGMDLQIQVLGSTDRLTVKDWYTPGSSGTDNQIERIQTADGRTMYNSDVAQFVQAMSAFAPPAATQTSWVNGQQSNGQVLLAVNH